MVYKSSGVKTLRISILQKQRSTRRFPSRHPQPAIVPSFFFHFTDRRIRIVSDRRKKTKKTTPSTYTACVYTFYIDIVSIVFCLPLPFPPSPTGCIEYKNVGISVTYWPSLYFRDYVRIVLPYFIDVLLVFIIHSRHTYQPYFIRLILPTQFCFSCLTSTHISFHIRQSRLQILCTHLRRKLRYDCLKKKKVYAMLLLRTRYG